MQIRYILKNMRYYLTSIYGYRSKNYLDGKYGAIPYFDIDEKLNQLLYGERK